MIEENGADWAVSPKQSFWWTIGLSCGLLIVSTIGIYNNWGLTVSITVGALGGLVHEFAQSGGKILFFEKAEDGMYMGSIAGMVLGSVAGILVVQGEIEKMRMVTDYDYTKLSIDVFLAGLSLKGVTEAAAGNKIMPSKKQETSNEEPPAVG